MREPLAGWAQWRHPYRGWTHWIDVGPYIVQACPSSWRLVEMEHPAYVGVAIPADIQASQLAAEDAARALVADMAEALGGTVAWSTEGEPTDV